MWKIKGKHKRFSSTLPAAYDQRLLFSGFPAVLCAPAPKLSSFHLWKAVDDPHAAALQTERATQALSTRPFTAAEKTCEIRKPEAIRLKIQQCPCGKCVTRDKREESNKNKRVTLCCTFACLKGTWLANDINTSIETR